MKRNVGGMDKAVRIVAGLALLGFFFVSSAPMHWLGLIGIVPLVTGLFGTCPLYSLIGIDTCPIDAKRT